MEDEEVCDKLSDSIPTVPVDQVPDVCPWKFPMMYKIGNNGVMYIWQVGFDGRNLMICYGTTNSSTIDLREVCVNTSGRTMMQQGHLEAMAKYKDKFYEGYIQVGSVEPPMVKLMKGYPYKAGCINKFPVLVSPKLNGTRCAGQHIGNGKVSCRSYLNNPITHLSAIEKDILALSTYLPAYTTLDGELYCHGMTFHGIISATKTVNSDHKDLNRIQFCIFDAIYDENPSSEIRYNRLVSAYQRLQEERGSPCTNLVIVPNYAANSHEDLVAYKDYFISMGYEGLAIRRMANGAIPGSKEYELSRYKPGRSTHFYKFKDFIDEEGIVVGVKETKGKESSMAKLIIRDQYGIDTPIRFGTASDRRAWLQQPQLVIGRAFTFKYEKRSEDNRPIQPTGVAFRDYE
jgi:ATP-dependent DNA ligase